MADTRHRGVHAAPKGSALVPFLVTIHSKAEMGRLLPDADRMWYWDCNGQTLLVRPATADDLQRCNWEGDPANYVCEDFEGGSVINRLTVKSYTFNPEQAKSLDALLGECERWLERFEDAHRERDPRMDYETVQVYVADLEALREIVAAARGEVPHG